jgi:hypothetical protein
MSIVEVVAIGLIALLAAIGIVWWSDKGDE